MVRVGAQKAVVLFASLGEIMATLGVLAKELWPRRDDEHGPMIGVFGQHAQGICGDRASHVLKPRDSIDEPAVAKCETFSRTRGSDVFQA